MQDELDNLTVRLVDHVAGDCSQPEYREAMQRAYDVHIIFLDRVNELRILAQHSAEKRFWGRGDTPRLRAMQQRTVAMLRDMYAVAEASRRRTRRALRTPDDTRLFAVEGRDDSDTDDEIVEDIVRARRGPDSREEDPQNATPNADDHAHRINDSGPTLELSETSVQTRASQQHIQSEPEGVTMDRGTQIEESPSRATTSTYDVNAPSDAPLSASSPRETEVEPLPEVQASNLACLGVPSMLEGIINFLCWLFCI